MRDLLTGRQHLGRVRMTTHAVALAAVLLSIRPMHHGPVALWAVGAVLVQVATVLLGPVWTGASFLRAVVAADILLLAAANALSSADLFALLVIPVLCAGAWLSIADVSWVVLASCALYAMGGSLEKADTAHAVSLALKAAILGLVGAAAHRMSAIHFDSRHHWRALIDLPSRGTTTIEEVRHLADVMAALLGAERALLFTSAGGRSFILDETRLTLSSAQADIAQALADTELAQGALVSGRPIAVANAAAEPRLPKHLAAGLGIKALLAVPVAATGVGRVLILLLNRPHGVPFDEDDAGIAQLMTLCAGTPASAPLPAPSEGLLDAAYEASFEAADSAVIVLDDRARIVTFNAVARALFSLDPEAAGKAAQDVLGCSAICGLIRESIELDAPRVQRTPPSGVEWSEAEVVPVFSDDVRLGTLVLARTCDEDAMGVAVDRVLACVSHELRTPLTAIKAYADTLARDVEFDPETRRKFLDIIREQTRRLADAVDALLMSAEKGEAGQADGPTGSIGEAIQAAIGELGYCTEDLEIEMDLLDDSPRTRCSEPLLKTGVRHFVLDALTRAAHDAPLVIREVRTEGEGILILEFAPATGHDMSIALSQAPMATAAIGPRPGGGIGLGLSVAKRSLESCGGVVSVSSPDGLRARWELRLPLA